MGWLKKLAESLNQFAGDKVIFRHSPQGEVWQPDEYLTFEEALYVYTLVAHRQLERK